MMQRTSPKVHIRARYLTLGIVFAVICLAFLGVLAAMQMRGELAVMGEQEEGYVRTYTVPGVRGEIYDCNGRLIVGNSTSYDLIYEYGAMPDTRRDVNRSLLAVMDAIIGTGNGDKLADDLFILEGTYPNMRFVAEKKNQDSEHYRQYLLFLSRQSMENSETDADDVVDYFVDRYSLLESLYSNEEITTLIRLYYEMERVDFGAYASYTIAEDVRMNVITAIEESNIEGVNFEIQERRKYSEEYAGLASHILGQLGRITAENADYYLGRGYSLDSLVGVSGCEAAFEDILRGTDGVMTIRYDDDGNLIEKYYSVEPVSGKDVYLTIDMELQKVAESALAENVSSIDGADAGAITAMDPETGAVLAIASYPTYDLSRVRETEYYASLLSDKSLPLYNRALQGSYAPGSTYKVGVALAALESGAIDESVTHVCNGSLTYHNTEYGCLGTHGKSNVIEAIRDSCNVFFYHLGDEMGIDAITAYTQRLGLGVPTGIELTATSGSVAGPKYREDWQLGDNLSAAIGQSDHKYTPLQLSVYMSTVVNGGTRQRAHLLDSVRAFYTGDVISTVQTETLDTVEMSDDTYELLLHSMELVVSSSNTISNYFSDVPEGVTVGGKTGTVQVTGRRDNAVFCGYGMTDGSADIVVSCVIEEGLAGYRASFAAAKVIEAYYAAQSADTGS